MARDESKDIENSIECYLKKQVEARGGICLKFTSGVRGVPDRVCLFPGAAVVFVECKRPKGGRLSALQGYWAARFAALGVSCGVACTRAEVDALIARAVACRA